MELHSLFLNVWKMMFDAVNVLHVVTEETTILGKAPCLKMSPRVFVALLVSVKLQS